MFNKQLNTICFIYVLLNAEFCCIYWKSWLSFFTILDSLNCCFIIFICPLPFPFRGRNNASLIYPWYISHGIQIWGWWEKKKVTEAWWYRNSFKFWDTIEKMILLSISKNLWTMGSKAFLFLSTSSPPASSLQLVRTDVPDIIDMTTMIHPWSPLSLQSEPLLSSVVCSMG